MALRELQQPAMHHVCPLSSSYQSHNALITWRRDPRRARGGFVWCHWTLAVGGGDIQLTTVGQISGKPTGGKRSVEELWREFFSDPLQWFDNRSEKVNGTYPDFTHKKTRDGLWLDDKLKPSWVEVQLAEMTPNTIPVGLFTWNKRLSGCNRDGLFEMTLEIFQQIQQKGLTPNTYTFVAVLRACSSLRALEEGRHIHGQIIISGCESHLFVGSSLVDMYAKCGSMDDAWGVFNKMSTRNVVSWSALILGFVKCGQGQKALELSQQMQREGVAPNSVTFLGLLNACGSVAALEDGRRVHEQIVQSGCESNLSVSNTLIDMYAKCGSIEDAWRVFQKMPERNVVSWTAMILGYVKCGEGQKALGLYEQMAGKGVEPNSITFVGVLNACANLAALAEGRRFHDIIIRRGYDSDVFIGSSLVDMYVKCGSIDDACIVFNKMPICNVVAWSTMIMGYVKCGQGQKALDLFRQMQREGVEPNSVTFVGVLNACASVAAPALEEGRRVHDEIIERGCESDLFIKNSLVDMYIKCGSIEDAWRVFGNMPNADVVTWNAMILGFMRCGRGQMALELFRQMNAEGVEPDVVTYVGVLNACANMMTLQEGRLLHERIIRSGLGPNVIVDNCLINMYSKCGCIEDALVVFNRMPTRTLVSWTCMIIGYVKCGKGRKALELYQEMLGKGIEPNSITFVGVLNACAAVRAPDEGRHVHSQIIQAGYESDLFVGSSLVDMYAKCGNLENAWEVFSNMPIRNVVTWTAMILGYVKCGEGQKALELYEQMHRDEVEPNFVTYVVVLNACTSIMALEKGRLIHEEIMQTGCESNIFVCSSLVEMYAKCGSIGDAWSVFNRMPVHNVVCWTAMIFGYVKCGEGQKALELYQKMLVEPNLLTFVGVLNACASVGALEGGRNVHQRIIQSGYEVDASLGNSLVDMYAKCGSIEDALRAFNNMPKHDVHSWNAILGGYAIHGLAEEAIKHFEWMCQERVDIDAVTFISLLTACGHGWLVGKGIKYFEEMEAVYSISRTVYHYACMVDLLCRAGRLPEAETLIRTMPCEADGSVWRSLLSAYRHQCNVEMGEHVAKQIMELQAEDPAGYVLLSNLYHTTGRWDLSADVRRQRLERNVKKQPGRTWIEVNNLVHSFTVNDHGHPQIVEIHEQLQRLFPHMHVAGYVPATRSMFHDVEDEEKNHLFHGEKLAIAYGLISTPPGTSLSIFKNLRVCEDCHTAIKFITKLVNRVIIVRDAVRFHRFQDGLCTCRDYW